MLNALVDVILPVVLVALVGVVLARKFALDADTLGKVSLYGFTPALAFQSMMDTSVTADAGMRLVVGYLLVTAVGAGLSALAAWRWDGDTRRSVIACTIIGNNGNFGLPIALLALGTPGLDQAIVIFVVSLVVMFTIGPMLLGSKGGLVGGLLTVARLPVTWALVAAFGLRMLDTTPPQGIQASIDLLADAAVPIVLVQLGVQLGQSGRIHRSTPVLVAVALRTLAIPALALGLGILVGLTGVPLASLVLACAMPTAVNAFMLAREYGADVETVASAVALSTLVSLVTLPVVISLLPALTGG